MSAEKDHLAERAARAEKIITAPQEYKICEGCDSIVKARVASCPNCHGWMIWSGRRMRVEITDTGFSTAMRGTGAASSRRTKSSASSVN